jgi:drug/metabolite transporter (DMT)-like permease
VKHNETLGTMNEEPNQEILPASRPSASAWTLNSTDVALLLVMLIWGVNMDVLKRILQDMSPLTANALRFTLSSAILLVMYSRQRSTHPMLRRDILQIVGAGVVGYGAGQIMLLVGLSLTTASQSALMNSTMPIFAALLGLVSHYERLSRRGWLGILISFLGIILVIGTTSGPDKWETMLGSLLVLSSALAWAISMLITAPVLRRASASQVAAVMTVTGTIILWLVASPSLAKENWSQVAPISWIGLVYSGIFALAVSNIIWNRAVHQIGPSRTAIFTNLTPIVAALGGWLFLSEHMSVMQWLGAAVILLGVYLVRIAKAT